MKKYRQSDNRPNRPSIGDHLYSLRKERKWTQSELAKRCGIAVSTVSKIENGQLSPSFETLLRVAEGLSMTIADLMTIDAYGQHRTRRSYTRNGEGEIHHTDVYDYELLCGDINDKIMHPLIARLKTDSVTEFGELFSHPGEELLYVLEGEIELHTEHYRPLRLSVGDCAYYDSTMGHACISVGEKEAVIFWVSTTTLLP
ncbi:MAG: XRE family transcriptional regulator [Pseudomonadota bacterium]